MKESGVLNVAGMAAFISARVAVKYFELDRWELNLKFRCDEKFKLKSGKSFPLIKRFENSVVLFLKGYMICKDLL